VPATGYAARTHPGGYSSGERCTPAPDVDDENADWDEETGEPVPPLLIGDGVVYLRTDTALHALH
jgi:hypothetical protein